MTTGLWLQEHGPGFAVPDLIARAEAIEDLSYRNDVCPAFGRHLTVGDDSEVDVRLWVDHPDEDERENGGASRFTVTVDAWDVNADLAHRLDEHDVPEGMVWAGGDERDALRSLLDTIHKVMEAIR